MKWSWRIGSIAGIRVQVHATFAILLAFVALSQWQAHHAAAAVVRGLVLVAAVFGTIVLHELGHALTARRFGIRTRDITLLPIGGVARLERMPDRPHQELLVAIAGPLVNAVLALGFAGSYAVLGAPIPLASQAESLPARLLWINVMLAVFNLLPAFPMDGGRVLRALLAMRMDYVRATQTAAHLGQAMALLFGILGLLGNPFLLFIALFVWMGASDEAAMVQLKAALGGIPIARTMITEFHTLAPDEPLGNAVTHMLAGFQQDFPVAREGEVVGVLTRADLVRALAQGGEGGRVAEAMQTRFVTADPAEMMESALARLQECACRSMPVVQGGRLVGMLTLDNVGEFVMVQSALREVRA